LRAVIAYLSSASRPSSASRDRLAEFAPHPVGELDRVHQEPNRHEYAGADKLRPGEGLTRKDAIDGVQHNRPPGTSSGDYFSLAPPHLFGRANYLLKSNTHAGTFACDNPRGNDIGARSYGSIASILHSLAGLEQTFRLSDGFFPVGTHVARKCAQSAHEVGAGHFKKEIDVCDRPFRTGLEPLPQLRPHVEGGDRVSE
jgi:hypothetical protein